MPANASIAAAPVSPDVATIIFILVFNFVVLLNNVLGAYFYNVAYRLPNDGFANFVIKLSINQVVLNLIALPFIFVSIAKGMLAIFILTVCFISINNLFEIFNFIIIPMFFK